MDAVLPLVLLFVGLALGVAGTWCVLRVRIQHEAARARGQVEAELAAAREQVQGRDGLLARQAEQVAELSRAQSDAEERLRAEIRGRSAAEQLAARVPALEAALAERESRIQSLQQEASDLRALRSTLEANLEQERSKMAEKLVLIDQAQARLTDAFKALASDALNTNNKSFLDLAQTTLQKFQETAQSDLEQRQKSIVELVKPVTESLEKVDGKIQELEKSRVGAYAALTNRVDALVEGNRQLSSETNRLVSALGSPNVRGRWGEMQLRRVVELAGMVERCHFNSQESVTTEDGRLRPDLVVRLPGGKSIVVDAKVPLTAYLEALETTNDDGYKQKMQEHARQVRSRMNDLCEKKYWAQFESSPEFVFLFLPGDIFFTAAIQHDPALIDYGVAKRVIIATPTTLIALLWSVYYGWQQEGIAENAKAISELGRELYKRIATMGSHMLKLGTNLDRAVLSYNETVASLERNVLAGARRFRDLKTPVEGLEIEELLPIERSARVLVKPELLESLDVETANENGQGALDPP